MKNLKWRMQSTPEGFDELVVGVALKGGECLIHAEMMNNRSIFVTIGDMKIWAHVDKDEEVVITHIEAGTSTAAKPKTYTRTICGAQSPGDPHDEDDPPVTCTREPHKDGLHEGGTRCGTLTWK